MEGAGADGPRKAHAPALTCGVSRRTYTRVYRKACTTTSAHACQVPREPAVLCGILSLSGHLLYSPRATPGSPRAPEDLPLCPRIALTSVTGSATAAPSGPATP